MNDIDQPFEVTAPGTAVSMDWLPGAWLVFIVLCVACDFLMAPIFSGVEPEELKVVAGMTVVGCTLAQGVLLAAWLVWSTGSFARRLGFHWAIAAGLCWVWLIGVSMSTIMGEMSLRDFKFVGFTVPLTVPLVSLATQLPLWAIRHLFGWRLAPQAAEANVVPESPLTIRDLLLATLVAAVAFGMARQSPYAREVRGFAAAWAIAAVVAGTISTMAMLPAAAIFLRRRSLERALTLGGLYAASLLGILWLAVGIMYWQGVSLPPYWAFIGLTGLMLSFGSTVVLAATLARAHGLRLVWGRARSV